MEGDLRKELDALRSDIASVQADLARIAETIGKGTGKAAEDAGETIRRRFEELQLLTSNRAYSFPNRLLRRTG